MMRGDECNHGGFFLHLGGTRHVGHSPSKRLHVGYNDFDSCLTLRLITAMPTLRSATDKQTMDEPAAKKRNALAETDNEVVEVSSSSHPRTSPTRHRIFRPSATLCQPPTSLLILLGTSFMKPACAQNLRNPRAGVMWPRRLTNRLQIIPTTLT